MNELPHEHWVEALPPENPALGAEPGEERREEPGAERDERPPIDSTAGESAPGVADSQSHRLDPRSITVERISGLITTAALMGGVVFAGTVLLVSTWPPPTAVVLIGSGAALLLLIFLLYLALIWPTVRYRHWSYTLSELGLELRRGVVFRAVSSVPRSRIQHTDVQQGPLQRRFGLASLVVHTAGTHNASETLPGISHERALAIRDYLLHGNGTAGHER